MNPRSTVLPLALAPLSAVLVPGAPASAGIWAWGCMGKLGNERVIFDRNTLIVTTSKEPRVKLQDLGSSGSKLETQDGTMFDNYGSNDGLKQTMRFETNGDPKQTLTLIETSSRTTFHHNGHVGKRDEETTKFLKTFRYSFGKEPARTIKMQCIEYQLSTCGGPCS